MKPQYFIVWNKDRTEGYITDDQNDAFAAVGKHSQMHIESVLSAAFRDTHDERTIQEVTIHPELSYRAQKLLERIKQGQWYSVNATDTPKAMQELIDHGLVITGGRVKEIERAYIAVGHTPFICDRAPDEPRV